MAVTAGAITVGLAARGDAVGWYNGLGGCTAARAVPCLDDSNSDWGQGSMRLAELLHQSYGGARPRLAWFGTSDPSYYLEHDRVAPGEFVAPYRALYAISSQRLVRVPGSPEEGGFFRATRPDATVGSSYRIYDLRGRTDLPPPP